MAADGDGRGPTEGNDLNVDDAESVFGASALALRLQLLQKRSRVTLTEYCRFPALKDLPTAQRRQQLIQTTTSTWIPIWAFQIARLIQWCHERDSTFVCFIEPARILTGSLYPAIRQYLHKQGVLLSGTGMALFASVQDRLMSWGTAPFTPDRNPPWASPEQLLGSTTATKRTDMWVFGCILYELYGNAAPFTKTEDLTDRDPDCYSKLIEMFSTIGSPDLATWPEAVLLPGFSRQFPRWPKRPFISVDNSTERALIDLINNLIVLAPSQRLGIDDVLRHDYFRPFYSLIDDISIQRPLSLSESFFPTWRRKSQASNEILLESQWVKNRHVLLDWLASVADEFGMCASTLYIAFKLIDVYVLPNQPPKGQLQLLGEICLSTAVKLAESDMIHLETWVFLSENAFTIEQFRRTEHDFLQSILSRSKSLITCCHDLEFFIRVHGGICPDRAGLARLILKTAFVELPEISWGGSKTLALSALCVALGVDQNNYTTSLPSLTPYFTETTGEVVSRLYQLCIRASNQLPSTRVKKCAPSWGYFGMSDRACSVRDDPVHQLDRGVLMQCLRYLKCADLARLSCLSKSWREVVLHKSLWTSITLNGSRSVNKLLMGSFTRSASLQYLNLSGSRISLSSLIQVCLVCPVLQSLLLDRAHCHQDLDRRVAIFPAHFGLLNLSIASAFITVDITAAMLTAFPNLCSFNCSDTPSYIGRALCRLPSSVRNLDLSSNSWLSDSIVSEISRRAQLTSLHMDYCPRVTTRVIGLLINPGLTHLSCSGNAVADCFLQLITKTCYQLTTLDLAFNSKLTSSEVLTSISNLRGLRQLALCKVPSTTDQAICLIAESCVNLHVINLRMCPKVGLLGLSALYDHCPDLQLIFCVQCPADLLQKFKTRRVQVLIDSR